MAAVVAVNGRLRVSEGPFTNTVGLCSTTSLVEGWLAHQFPEQSPTGLAIPRDLHGRVSHALRRGGRLDGAADRRRQEAQHHHGQTRPSLRCACLMTVANVCGSIRAACLITLLNFDGLFCMAVSSVTGSMSLG